MSAFFIIPARAKKSLMNIFADHPPLEQRLAALRAAGVPAAGHRRRLSRGPARHPHRPPPGQGPGARPAVRDLDRLRRRCRAEHQIDPAGSAAIVFQALATSEFEATMQGHGRSRHGHRRRERHDGRHRRTTATATAGWCCATPTGAPSVEDLAVGINAVVELDRDGRLRRAAAVRRVRLRRRARSGAIYFIYNYKRGYWYPFVPAPGDAQERSTERELQLKAQIGDELPIEPELERWFPLWGIPI